MVTGVLISLLLAPKHSKPCCDPMAAFVSDPAFVAAHQSPRPLRFLRKEGKSVQFDVADGSPASGYWVGPKTDQSPAVVMVHEWWGLNDNIRREAEQLHDKLGYAVLAVDLYDGKVATSPQDAGKLMQSVDVARATGIVTGAMVGLKKGTFGRPFNKVGTIGWCFGGGWSNRAAIAGGPLVKACVMYYGMPDTDPTDLEKLKAPVLMVWATQDKWINADVVNNFKSAMATTHHPLTVLPYDAAHGFANPSNPIYNKSATESAMAKTVKFFKKNLGV